jgi:hypothetical protein
MAKRNVLRSVLLHVALCAAFLARTEVVHAQSNTALAESLYQEGKRLMNERKFDQACPKLLESHKLDPATGTLLNLAACYEGAGKYASAWAYYNDALGAAKRGNQEARVTYASEQLKKIEERLTRLQIELAPGASVPGLEVKLDGQTISSAALGFPSPVDPGKHVVEASAPGKKSVRVEVVANAPKTVVKTVVPVLEDETGAAPEVAAPQPDSASPATEPSTKSSGSGLTTLGWVLGGVGVAAIGAGVVFNLSARSDVDRSDNACTQPPDGNTCRDRNDQIEYRDAVSAAETKSTISYVGLGLGSAALATGITLLIVGGGDDHEAPPVALAVTERSVGLSAGGTW